MEGLEYRQGTENEGIGLPTRDVFYVTYKAKGGTSIAFALETICRAVIASRTFRFNRCFGPALKHGIEAFEMKQVG